MSVHVICRTLSVIVLAGLSLIMLPGCAVQNQADVARAAIPPEQVPGIDEPYSINWSWPEPSGPASREFSEVQAHPFYVHSHDGQVTRLYVVEGKDIHSGRWRLIHAAKQINGQWTPVQLTIPSVAVAASAR